MIRRLSKRSGESRPASSEATSLFRPFTATDLWYV
jgi:hypothetical protein